MSIYSNFYKANEFSILKLRTDIYFNKNPFNNDM